MTKTELFLQQVELEIAKLRKREVILYTNADSFKQILETRFPGTKVEVVELPEPSVIPNNWLEKQYLRLDDWNFPATLQTSVYWESYPDIKAEVFDGKFWQMYNTREEDLNELSGRTKKKSKPNKKFKTK